MQLSWQKKATHLLKAELSRRGMTYEQLQEKLTAIGVKETTNSINVKINRGSFSFAFFLQVMKAIEGKVLRIDED